MQVHPATSQRSALLAVVPCTGKYTVYKQNVLPHATIVSMHVGGGHPLKLSVEVPSKISQDTTGGHSSLTCKELNSISVHSPVHSQFTTN